MRRRRLAPLPTIVRPRKKPVKQINRERVVNHESGCNLWIDDNGGYWLKMLDGDFLKCFNTGYIKNQVTENYVCNYGRAFKKEKNTVEETQRVMAFITAAMEKAFPNSVTQQGKIRRYYIYSHIRD